MMKKFHSFFHYFFNLVIVVHSLFHYFLASVFRLHCHFFHNDIQWEKKWNFIYSPGQLVWMPRQRRRRRVWVQGISILDSRIWRPVFSMPGPAAWVKRGHGKVWGVMNFHKNYELISFIISLFFQKCGF